ncbi:hypothetical protein N7541_001082 [Penicillium brevicompactum]|uniref:Urease accessory protein UreD n=1 Tax=Penicillium brevicompactum TaxID=5074 RepID=A0A9W9RVJ4_PENBR|nr:uncharacterized protein N7506_001218 [Penicillium brevicompactum]KAJ5328789.1 hypothetical protein N7452_009179 [Penicillium brevicompactum]KAJ5347965.1 hypothetical protein N7506_001218 [Penicillium brevicompactum]KAJ5367141.1 hypothetical protein N7541_001082 [Penicillium brevicompactum]
MPHKHKRRGEPIQPSPEEIAKALPVRDPSKPKTTNNGKKGKGGNKNQNQTQNQNQSANKAPTHRRKNVTEDDTPKAFVRLMQFQTTGKRAPSGLETGESNKKRKRAEKEKSDSNKKSATEAPQQAKAADKQSLKILPGERLAEFSARVDREMPMSQMTKTTKSGEAKANEQRKRTKHEKHLRRLQSGWREEEAKIKEREEEQREEREAEMEVELQQWKDWDIEAGGKAKKRALAAKKNKKIKGGDGEVDSGDDDPDPWAKLKKRDQERKKNPFEVAPAPPSLIKPREIFKVRGGAKVDVANVPSAVGSLRRREELAGERRNIVEEYRKLMAEKRQ